MNIDPLLQEAATMGTSIDCFFASETEWAPEALELRLNSLCSALQTDLDEIRLKGRFSGSSGNWYVLQQQGEQRDANWLSGEGPAGLGIHVYRRVMCLTSAERFGALYDDSSRVVAPLRRVLCSLAISLAKPTKVAIAPAGLGGTDVAGEIACAGGSFEDVWKELDASPPTDTWAGLWEWSWYLGPPIPSLDPNLA